MLIHDTIIAQPRRAEVHVVPRTNLPPMPNSLPAINPDEGERQTASRQVLAEWTVHLARLQPAKLVGIAAGMIAAFALGCMAFESWVGGALGAGLVSSAVAEFLLPIRYRLTTDAAHCSYGLARLMIPWQSVRRVIVGSSSLRLSPFAGPSRLDAFRGVELRWDDAVMPEERLREIIGRYVTSGEERTSDDEGPRDKDHVC